MTLRIRSVLPIVVLAVAGCGFFGDDAPGEGAATGSVAVADSSEGGTAEAAEEGAATDTSAGAASGTTPAGGRAGGPAGVAPGAGEPQAQAQPTDTLAYLLSRLDSLLAGQRTLARRIDSLSASATAAADSARIALPSTEVLGEAGRSVRGFGIAALMSALVIILFNVVIRGTVWVLDALAERNARRRLFYKRLAPIIRIVLWIFAAYLIVSVIFGISAQGIFAAAAAIGVAVGFAAQDLLKNLFGGLILVFDQPFQVGDKITVGETYGEVVSIGLRSTRIVTADDNLVSVPNAQVVDQQVANANAGELNCQVVTDLYLPGWADEEAAKRIAFQAAASSKYVFLNKPVVVLVSDVFKETFLTRVRVKAYVLDPRYEFLFQSDVTERARAGFRQAGLLRTEHMRAFLVEEALQRASEGARGDGAENGRGASKAPAGDGASTTAPEAEPAIGDRETPPLEGSEGREEGGDGPPTEAAEGGQEGDS